MRLSKKIALVVVPIVIVFAWTARYFVYVPAIEPPPLDGALQHHALDIDGIERRFSYYLPPNLSPGRPAVVLFHGSRGSGERIREATGFGFDRLADEHGFVVLYPDGYQGNWNDCRAVGDYPAKQLAIDDTAFIRQALDYLRDQHAIDSSQVFAAGLSNGGQMVLRLAMETPELIRGAAAIAANMPAPDNLDCEPVGAARAIMLVNGTADPINPFEGGEVEMFGGVGKRGEVRSSIESASYWARIAGHTEAPFEHRYPDSDPDDESVATRKVWADAGRPEVSLITVHGGGHTIPDPQVGFPRFLGPTNRDFVAPDEIWRFFQRELERARTP